MRRKIFLICVDSGGGHRAAATALTEVVREQERPWDVETISIQELLDPIDFVQYCTGIPFQEVYNIMLRRGWTLASTHMIRLAHALIRLSHKAQVRTLQRFWEEQDPDLVVS